MEQWAQHLDPCDAGLSEFEASVARDGGAHWAGGPKATALRVIWAGYHGTRHDSDAW